MGRHEGPAWTPPGAADFAAHYKAPPTEAQFAAFKARSRSAPTPPPPSLRGRGLEMARSAVMYPPGPKSQPAAWLAAGGSEIPERVPPRAMDTAMSAAATSSDVDAAAVPADEMESTMWTIIDVVDAGQVQSVQQPAEVEVGQEVCDVVAEARSLAPKAKAEGGGKGEFAASPG